MLKLTDIGNNILIEDVDNINVENKNISKMNTGYSFFPDTGDFLVWSKMNRVYILLGNYDEFQKSDDTTPESIGDAKDYLNSLFKDGEVSPPNYDELTQFLKVVNDDVYVDEIGVREGESFTGIYSDNGISQLNLENLTGRSIIEFHGTSPYSIVGNNVILDPLLTFSSLVLDTGELYSIECINEDNNAIIGTQQCLIVGTPTIAESIDYKSWRDLLGYNIEDGDYFGDDLGNFWADDLSNYFGVEA